MPPGISRRRILQSAAISAGAAAAGAFAGAYVAKRPPRRNVILVVADTFRADRLGLVRPLDGARASITPFLDGMAGYGLNFTNAFAPSSWTPISICSILYDASPLAVGYSGSLQVNTPNPPLAKVLAARGYYTACVNANGSMNTYAVRRGFDFFHSFQEPRKRLSSEDPRKPHYHCADEINGITRGLAERLRRSRSYFIYLHYMDNHDPYFFRDKHLRRIGARYEPYANVAWMRDKLDNGGGELRPGLSFDEGMEHLETQYDASVLYIDESLAEQFEWFERQGLLEDTLVIFTSDHGEEFLDNVEVEPTLGHARNLSQPELRTPLVVWRPGKQQNVNIYQPVSSRRIINDCVKDFVAGYEPRGDVSGTVQADILSALNFMGFNGVSIIEGSVKVTGLFADDGRLDPASIKAFRIGEGIEARGIERTEEIERFLRVRLEGALVGGWSTEDLAPEERDRLRALGYLN